MHKLQERNLKRFFHWYDYNNDGVISIDDAQSVVDNMARIRNLPIGSEEYKAFRDGFLIYWKTMVETLGKDVSDTITESEWLDVHATLLEDEVVFEQTILRSVQFIFDLMDLNNDGLLTMEEYGLMMKAWRIDPIEIVHETFIHLDINKTGQLTMDDLHKLFYQFFYSDDPKAPGHWCFGTPW